MSHLVLSLFPGIGLLDMAFEAEGFCVVRGPDLLWGGDVRRFHPPAGKFDGVIGGPPCQAFSRLRLLVEWNGHEVAPNLIPEFERCVSEARPGWFVMENVPAAPRPSVPGYVTKAQTVRDHWVGGETRRERVFSFGSAHGLALPVEFLALHRTQPAPPVLASGFDAGGRRGKARRSTAAHLGYKTLETFEAGRRLQGLPDDYDLPAFTVAAKCKAIGNGVPLPMGRAIARAVEAALGIDGEATA